MPLPVLYLRNNRGKKYENDFNAFAMEIKTSNICQEHINFTLKDSKQTSDCFFLNIILE